MPEPHFHLRPVGYDRREVDAFVERTAERLDAALEARTPDGAVKKALERVGEETSAVLQRAHQIAEEITARSRAAADDRRLQAEQEAAAIQQDAEARVAAFDAELEMLWQERQRLINDIDRISEQLRALVTQADERFPEEQDPPETETQNEEETGQPASPAGDAPGAVVAGNAEPPEDATQEMARIDPAPEMDSTGSRSAAG